MDILNRIIDIEAGALSRHSRIRNLYAVHGLELPALPPPIVRCKIRLKSGPWLTSHAMLEYNRYPHYIPEEGDMDEFFWKVLHKNPVKRIRYTLGHVSSWEFV
jgi:hypothetical protein